MSKEGNALRRSEVTETLAKNREGLNEKSDTCEKYVSDIKTIRGTLERLKFAGTDTGADAVEGHIQQAEQVTEDGFEQNDQELEEQQEQVQDHEEELEDHSEQSKEDLDEIAGVEGQLETSDAVQDLKAAKDACLEDIDFLIKGLEEARHDREKSEQVQKKHQDQVRK